jgi:hypothetical protein
MCAALFPYVWKHGEKCHGADGRPGESRSGRGVVVRHVLVQERFRWWRRSGWSSKRSPWADSRVPSTGGAVRGTVAVVTTSCPRALQQHRDVITVPGVVRQWRGWPHRVDSDGKDRSRRPDVTAWPCIVTEKAFEGAAVPPSRARCVSRTGVGGTVSRS